MIRKTWLWRGAANFSEKVYLMLLQINTDYPMKRSGDGKMLLMTILEYVIAILYILRIKACKLNLIMLTCLFVGTLFIIIYWFLFDLGFLFFNCFVCGCW